MSRLCIGDAGFNGVEVVAPSASSPHLFMADVNRALVAMEALRLYVETAGPALNRDADAMAAALSRLDAALGAAVCALHGAVSEDDEAA